MTNPRPFPFRLVPRLLPEALVKFLGELGFVFDPVEVAFYFKGKEARTPFFLCVRKTDTAQVFTVRAYLPEVFRSYDAVIEWGSAVADTRTYLEDFKLPVTTLLRRRRLRALRQP